MCEHPGNKIARRAKSSTTHPQQSRSIGQFTNGSPQSAKSFGPYSYTIRKTADNEDIPFRCDMILCYGSDDAHQTILAVSIHRFQSSLLPGVVLLSWRKVILVSILNTPGRHFCDNSQTHVMPAIYTAQSELDANQDFVSPGPSLRFLLGSYFFKVKHLNIRYQKTSFMRPLPRRESGYIYAAPSVQLRIKGLPSLQKCRIRDLCKEKRSCFLQKCSKLTLLMECRCRASAWRPENLLSLFGY